MAAIIIAILIFGLLIIVHELGHYLFARLFDVEINEFSIGMGPALFSKTSKRSGIKYSLRAFPIGGYVSMVGENDEVEDNPRAFSAKPAWKRLVITVAGAAINIIIGFILMFIFTATQPAYGSTVVAVFNNENIEESITYQAGLRVDDKIISVDGVNVKTADDLVYQVSMRGAEPCDIEIERNGERIILKDVNFPTEEQDGITFGTIDFKVYGVKKTFTSLVTSAFTQCKTAVNMVIDSLWGLVSGKFGIGQVSGVVGTTEALGNAAKMGITTLIYFCAVISVNLGMVNLLPIPALDGGHILFNLIELVFRKPVPKKIESYIHAVGMVLLLTFVVVVSVSDIIKIVSRLFG